jgi:peptidoglycan DL-endopeptidase CwlO
VLTAGAIALAAVTPALEPVERAVAVQAAPPAAPVSDDRNRPETVRLDPESAFAARVVTARRASRATIRRAAVRPAAVRPPVTAASRRPAVVPGRVRTADSEAAERRSEPARLTRANRLTRSVRVRSVRRAASRVRTVVRHTVAPRGTQRVLRLGNMTAVIAYARQQVGKRYVSGGEGAGGFDCSGLTRAAYARAGIRLPHSSGAQAARARRISRSQARPGDLVVGPGHVGIYMGNGMMIDAGNHRTGVVYRRLYSGLSVERL